MNTYNLPTKSFYFECSGHHMGNKGDVAMLKCLINMLEKHYPESRYCVPIAKLSEEDFDQLDVQPMEPLEDYILAQGQYKPLSLVTKMVWSLFIKLKRAFRVAAVILAAYRMRKSSQRPRENSAPYQNLWTMKSAEAVIISGGGYINDIWAIPSAIRCGLVPFLGRIFCKPVVFSGHGIGPLQKGWLKLWLRFCLKEVKFFGLREGLQSPKILKELAVPSDKIMVTGDDSFGLRSMYTRDQVRQKLGIEKGKVVIGLNIRLHGYNQNVENYIDKIADIIKRSTLRLNACVLFICTDFTPWTKNDLRAVMDFGRLLPHNIDFKYVNEQIQPEYIKSLAGACNIIVSHSYHVLVFSLSQNVPAVGFYNCRYYEDKTKGVFDFVGSIEGAVDLRTNDVEQVVDKIVQLYESKNNREQLQRGVEQWEKLRQEWENKIISIIES